jgi:sugar phosphate isomerase/epimerase
MELSVTTDYVTGLGDPLPQLRRIAEAGFTHIHWCHEWNTDYSYSDEDISRIGTQLEELGLELLDLHASVGVERSWISPDQESRRAGIDLVRNRMEMARRLGSDAIVMHPPFAADNDSCRAIRKRWLASLEELADDSARTHVRIALENGNQRGFEETEMAFERHGDEYLGLCFDSGHANLHGAELLERHPERLLVLHLHDNDGSGDQHRIPFTGTVDWEKVAALIAGSSYRKCISLEVSMRNSPISDEDEFLAGTHAAAKKLSKMIEDQRSAE